MKFETSEPRLLRCNNLTDLTRLITFLILILLHATSKMGMYGLLYIYTDLFTLRTAFL